ncbi:leucyl aminopeptidase family protein [Sphingosinicella soli]|uniref:Leucyl aminopeptidase n=1 Tax=Sphingosinicella soli TaxID=333708 RepID=A0A7W7B0R8_9SPHN|nr:leucyl aminopeptidase family protein [Sphingosinicella soli]MBB4630933.1 leucyl aminopeptidase [Sphingosinicella soli]
MDSPSLIEHDTGQDAREIMLVDPSGFEAWWDALPARARAAVEAAQFKGAAGTRVILYGADPESWSAAFGAPATLEPWDLAGAVKALPAGRYRLAGREPGAAALGWILAHYTYTRYQSAPKPVEPRVLLVPKSVDIAALQQLAGAQSLVRDLVNTPAEDMGPEALDAAVRDVARHHGAEVKTITGDALLAANLPTIHAVGRAAAAGREPRLIDMAWGRKGDPKLTIIGKGVCFDSGGLDIKTSGSMLLMKKDMGGAAHALALAGLVMGAKLRVRLRLLIPAVENAIDGSAFRPGDIIRTRKGTTVEIGNTDAEGRLVLCDALTLAGEDNPDLVLDFATLTGAARVALGPDLPALFANDDALAERLLDAAKASGDPLWRMPLWKPYADMLKSDIADINNSASGGFAGAITAALYLEKFVDPKTPWAHLDTFAWMPTAKPGRPKGGEALGLRAFWAYVERRYGNHRNE